MSNTPAHRFPPFLIVLQASLAVLGGVILGIWVTRSMSPKELALSLLFGVGVGVFLYLLGLVIARGLTRRTARITARHSSSHPTGIDDHPEKKGDD